jgi:hypothetical protein
MTIYEEDEWYEWVEDGELAALGDDLASIRKDLQDLERSLERCEGLGIDPGTGLPFEGAAEEEPEPGFVFPMPLDVSAISCYRYRKPDYIPDRALFFTVRGEGVPDKNARRGHFFPEDWPGLKEISWIITDKKGTVFTQQTRLFNDDRVNNRKALHKFRDVLNHSYLIVSNNLIFDANMVNAAMKREGFACEEILDNQVYYLRDRLPKEADPIARLKNVAACFWTKQRNGQL